MVDTTLNVPSSQSADAVKNAVDNILPAGGDIAGMPIVSSSSTVNPQPEDPPEISEAQADLGLILGLSLPLLLILLSLVVICKFRSRETTDSSGDSGIDSNTYFVSSSKS